MSDETPVSASAEAPVTCPVGLHELEARINQSMRVGELPIGVICTKCGLDLNAVDLLHAQYHDVLNHFTTAFAAMLPGRQVQQPQADISDPNYFDQGTAPAPRRPPSRYRDRLQQLPRAPRGPSAEDREAWEAMQSERVAAETSRDPHLNAMAFTGTLDNGQVDNRPSQDYAGRRPTLEELNRFKANHTGIGAVGFEPA